MNSTFSSQSKLCTCGNLSCYHYKGTLCIYIMSCLTVHTLAPSIHYVYTRTYTLLYTHSRPLLARAPVSVHSLAYTPWHTHFRKCRAGKGNRRLHLPHSSIFSEQVLAWGLQTILKACVQHVCGSPETALQFKEFIHRCAISIKFF